MCQEQIVESIGGALTGGKRIPLAHAFNISNTGYILKGTPKKTTRDRKPVIGRHLSEILMYKTDVDKILQSIKKVILKFIPIFLDYFVENFYFVAVITPILNNDKSVRVDGIHVHGKITGKKALKLLAIKANSTMIRKRKLECLLK